MQRLRSGERSGRSAAGVLGGFAGATDALGSATIGEGLKESVMNGAETARFISYLCREGVKPELDAQRAVGTD